MLAKKNAPPAYGMDAWIFAVEVNSGFPDYMTQGESLEELKENLADLYKELSSSQ